MRFTADNPKRGHVCTWCYTEAAMGRLMNVNDLTA